MRLSITPPFMESESSLPGIQDSATVPCPALDKLRLMSYTFKFRFSNSSHLTNGLFRFPDFSFTRTFMSRFPHPLWFDQSNYISWKARTANSHLVTSPAILFLCSLIGPNVLLSTLFSHILNRVLPSPPTSGGRSVGIVRLRTQATEFVLFVLPSRKVSCE
jgi:hypothetical protein